MFGRRRPYRRIYGVIGSCLCTVLWIYVAVKFAATGRDILIPLAAAIIFFGCAIGELYNYRKYGNGGKPGQKSPAAGVEAAKPKTKG